MYSPSTNEDKTPQASSRRTWTQQQTLSVHVVFYIQSEMDDTGLSSHVKKEDNYQVYLSRCIEINDIYFIARCEIQVNWQRKMKHSAFFNN